MSISLSEAMSSCPLGCEECSDCPRYMDDCDGNEEQWDKEEAERLGITIEEYHKMWEEN